MSGKSCLICQAVLFFSLILAILALYGLASNPIAFSTLNSFSPRMRMVGITKVLVSLIYRGTKRLLHAMIKRERYILTIWMVVGTRVLLLKV
jgi:hypothetical protein